MQVIRSAMFVAMRAMKIDREARMIDRGKPADLILVAG